MAKAKNKTQVTAIEPGEFIAAVEPEKKSRTLRLCSHSSTA